MSHPKARKALTLLTAVNYLNYIDRFILSAVLLSIKKDLGLSDFQAGLLATAFMVPYMFTAPLFGWLGDTRDRSKILSFGAGLWSIATFITGIAPSFNLMLASRFLLGIGESAFTTIAVPFLSGFYKPEKQGRALAIMASGLPVGAALGYVLGGVLGSTVGWRNAFYLVGFPGLVLAGFIWKLGDSRVLAHDEKFNLKQTFKYFLSNKAYVFTVAGYCAYAFVVGGIAHWIPTYMQRDYNLSELNANTIFGGIAVGSGLVGTLLGGWAGDLFESKKKEGHLLVSAISMLLAIPAFWFCMQSSNIQQFAVGLVFAQLCFFFSTSPINVAVLRMIPKHLQNSAMAFLIFMSHILGDSISAPLIGKISDSTGSLKDGILVCTPVIFLSTLFWFLGRRSFQRSNQ